MLYAPFDLYVLIFFQFLSSMRDFKNLEVIIPNGKLNNIYSFCSIGSKTPKWNKFLKDIYLIRDKLKRIIKKLLSLKKRKGWINIPPKLLNIICKLGKHSTNKKKAIIIIPQSSCDSIRTVNTGCIEEFKVQGRSYLDNTVDISHCSFQRYSVFSGSGGIIYVKSETHSLSIYYSMFYNCECSEKGGAIYFNSNNSTLKLICANRCSASNSCFSEISTRNNNHVEYSSIALCSFSPTKSWSFSLSNGDILYENDNNSLNTVVAISGLYLFNPKSFKCSFSTFSSNKVEVGICIYLQWNLGSIVYSNIINNNSPNLGIFHVHGKYQFQYCVFNNNQNALFSLHDGTLHVSHSSISHKGFISNFSYVTLNNNSMTLKPTFQFKYLNSYYCRADIPIPVPSPEKTGYRAKTFQSTHNRTPISSPKITQNMTQMRSLIVSPAVTFGLSFGDLFRDKWDFTIEYGVLLTLLLQ